MDGRVKRPDLCNRTIALEWIAGATHLDLSIKYSCSVQTINNRMKAARRDHSDLPWGDREDVRKGAPKEGSVRAYTTMKDGKPGQSDLRQGYIIKSTKMRNR